VNYARISMKADGKQIYSADLEQCLAGLGPSGSNCRWRQVWLGWDRFGSAAWAWAG